jgi:glycosyltransferase involved in cell wall biosynthesis
MPHIVLAGPLTDCGYVAACANLKCPWIAQSWAFDVFWEIGRAHTNNERCQVALKSCFGLFADCNAVVEACEALCRSAFPVKYIMPWGLEWPHASFNVEREVVRKKYGLEGRQVFLHTRGLEPIYSVETLLEAFSRLHSLRPSTMLLLASNGSARTTVEKWIADAGLQEDVLLLGALPHDDVLKLFRGADFYVSCAASDGTSVSMLEAMNAGLLVIVSDVGGNPEWIHNGSNGWIFPIGNASELRRVMIEAVEMEPGHRNHYIEYNIRLVLEKADWEKNFGAFVTFLKDCASSMQFNRSDQSRLQQKLPSST